MIGFLGYISNSNKGEVIDYDFFQDRPFLKDSYSTSNFYITRKLNKKFDSDKVFCSNKNVFLAVDGVILNLSDLKTHYKQTNNFDLLNFLYLKRGEGLIDELKGDFSLVVFDKIDSKLFVYTNITTSKPIYYYNNTIEKELFFASNALILAEFLKSRKVKLTKNINAFYSIASYGYLFSDNHFTNEIKKLDGGSYLSFKENLKKKFYLTLKSFPQINLSESKSISKINELFNSAIELQYEKDLEYNYKHLSTLSGGLDSRMTTLLGLKKGYNNIDTITFSSPGYWDEIIAKHISKRYKINNIIFSVNNGDHLIKYDNSLFLNGGLLSYFVANQMSNLYASIDFEEYGLLHTGQVGDAIIGSTLHNYKSHFEGAYFRPKYLGECYKQVDNEIQKSMNLSDSTEICKFKNHVFNYTLEGNQYIYPFTESVSPFLDKDLLQFCLAIPLKLRNNHNLYYKWIRDFYPEIGIFFYEKTKRRTIKIENKYLNKVYHELMKAYFRFMGLKENKNALLNFEKWSKNIALTETLGKTFLEKVDVVEEETLKRNLEEQYSSDDFQNKLRALHALLTYELYFG